VKFFDSLRLRLLLGGAAWIAVALVASWLFIVTNFAVMIENDRRSDLQAGFDRIVAEIDPDVTPVIGDGPLTDPRYDTPLSGVYWQVEDVETGEVLRSRSLWDIELPHLERRDGQATISQVNTPTGTTLIILSQLVRAERIDGSERPLAIAVAEERDTDDDPVVRFGATLAAFLVALAIALFIAAYAQVSIGLRPLQLLRRQIAAVRSGEAERLPTATTLELRPVTEQVNDLLEAQEATIDFARQRAADLAHGLKTPLAVLGATADRLRKAGDADNADTLGLLTEQMNSRIDYQLRIARLRYRTRAQGAHASVKDNVLRSVAVLRKAQNGEHLNWTIELDDRLDVDMDSHDLLELVGILLENASQWARQSISVRGTRSEGAVLLEIEDDGEGLTDEQITRLGERGVRLDERSHGEGLGLSIAFEILRLNRGDLRLGRARSGGLRVEVRMPSGGTVGSA
jgi:signal transduction histidine kinase